MKQLTPFEQNLAGRNLNKKDLIQARFDHLNAFDIDLKKRRDKETQTLSLVEQMNDRLTELGQKGFAYKRLNTSMGNQIAEFARIKQDPRILGLLDHLKTSGGNYGSTRDGLELKRTTANQIDADIDNQERAAERYYNWSLKLDIAEAKKGIGTWVTKLNNSTDPEDIQEAKDEIQKIITNTSTEGYGDIISRYLTDLTTQADKDITKQKRYVGVDNILSPDSPKTLRSIVTEVLKDPSNERDRKGAISLALVQEGLTPNKNAQAWVDGVIDSYVTYSSTEEWTRDTIPYLNRVVSNQLKQYNVTISPLGDLRALMGGDSPKNVPIGVQEVIREYTQKARDIFQRAYSDYGNLLEGDEEHPKFGYKQWTPDEKGTFQQKLWEGQNNREGLRSVFEKLDKELKTIKEAQKEPENDTKLHSELISTTMPVRDLGPETYSELEEMLFEGNIINNPAVAREKLKLFWLALDPKSELHQVLKEWGWLSADNDFLDWWQAHSEGVEEKHLPALKLDIWNWADYLIRRSAIARLKRQGKKIDPALLKASPPPRGFIQKPTTTNKNKKLESPIEELKKLLKGILGVSK